MEFTCHNVRSKFASKERERVARHDTNMQDVLKPNPLPKNKPPQMAGARIYLTIISPL